MAYHAKQRILYYKRFKLDIWGIFKNTLQWKNVRQNYYIDAYNKLIGFLKFSNKRQTKIYKVQKIYCDYCFSKKEEKRGLYWRGILVTNKMRKWRPKHWLSTDIYKKTKLELLLISNLLFKVFKIGITKKVNKVMFFFSKKKQVRKKIYYRAPFIYDIRDKAFRKKTFFTKSQFASLRVARLFYIIYNYRQFKRLNKKAKKMDGLFEQNYILLMECKLPSIIYRSALFPNMFESIPFVKNSNVWINKKFVPYIYYSVKPMDLVGFRILYKSYIYWKFFRRMRRYACIFLMPPFLYISLSFLWFILIIVPLKRHIINPISMDLYRIGNYAN